MYIPPHSDRQVGIPEAEENRITASEFNQILSELQYLITQGGLTPNATVTTQVYQAIMALISANSSSVTNLSWGGFGSTGGTIASSTGTDATIPFATESTSGLVTPALLAAKQNALISGASLKEINGKTLLGGGDVSLGKADVGLGNVDNTSDANKPISTAVQTALNAKQGTITTGTTSEVFLGDLSLSAVKTVNGTTLLGSGNIDTLSLSITTESTSARTLSNNDNGKLIRYTNASGCTVTVPSSLALGFHAIHRQEGTGQVSFVGSGGMTIYNADSQSKTAKLYAGVSTIVGTTNQCVLDGYTGA